jgi:hypothetical protein
MPFRLGQLRFGISNVLLATLWLAAWLALCLRLEDLERVSRRGLVAIFLVEAPLAMFLVAGPFIAFGSLFLRTRLGLGVGLALASVIVVLLVLMSFKRLI